jgi:hypothetical protein
LLFLAPLNNESFEKFPPDYEAKWGAAMNLGDAGRSSIKGHDIAFYQDSLREVREKTLVEFAKRDDAWLLTLLKGPGWGGGPVNNYCCGFTSASTSRTTPARSTF